MFNKIDEETGEIYPSKRIFLLNPGLIDWNENVDYIPCGKCQGCRIAKSSDWATRCYLEAQKWPKNAFLTLTYNNDSLPKKRSLKRKDMQDFLKRLRKTLKEPIKVFYSGEYGPRTRRPHYHACIMNYWPEDAKFYKFNFQNDKLFTSETLNKIWRNGYVIVAQLNYKTAAYVARYVYKKAYKEIDEIPLKKGQETEFSISSKRPAIAKSYFMDKKEWEKILRNNGVLTYTDHVQLKPIPQYLLNLWKKENPTEYYEYKKKNNEKLKQSWKEILAKTTLNYGQYLQQTFKLKKEQLKRLDKRQDL